LHRALTTLFGRTETSLAAVLVVVVVVFSLASPYFLTLSNFSDLIEAHCVTTILAAGVFVVLVSGGIDISFAAVASVTQYVAAIAATRHGVPALPAIALACTIGMLLGLINALLTYYLNVVSIIVTIATSSIFYALLIFFTGGSEIYNLPDWWTDRIVFFRLETAGGDVARLTLPMAVMVPVVVATHLMMARTNAGRQIYALGGNPEAASRVGIRILRIQLLVYGYLGCLAGLAGFVQAHRVHQVVPTAMFGTELGVLAVAILGGASLAGGQGSMIGVVLGVLLLAMLQNGLNLLGVSPYFFDVVIGLAILISISATAFTERGARRRRRIAGAAT
jgi:simple sugar transport system permease protein